MFIGAGEVALQAILLCAAGTRCSNLTADVGCPVVEGVGWLGLNFLGSGGANGFSRRTVLAGPIRNYDGLETIFLFRYSRYTMATHPWACYCGLWKRGGATLRC